MLDLIMNILEVNKLENLRMKINLVPFDLTQTLAKLFEKFSFLLINTSVDLKIRIPDFLFVYADMQLTERVFDNLLSNSLKYTSPGGTITLTAFESGEEIRIEVRDTGSGIPANILNEVFKEHFHGDNRSFAYSNPSGIGLAYCKLAVEAQGREY